jgi:hypothetical protein
MQIRNSATSWRSTRVFSLHLNTTRYAIKASDRTQEIPFAPTPRPQPSRAHLRVRHFHPSTLPTRKIHLSNMLRWLANGPHRPPGGKHLHRPIQVVSVQSDPPILQEPFDVRGSAIAKRNIFLKVVVHLIPMLLAASTWTFIYSCNPSVSDVFS